MAATPIPAATILLLRDGASGLEVLMIERHQGTAFAGGALVFPGGKVAKEDHEADWASHVDGEFAVEERALRIAAVREAFEETGLLLARKANERGERAPLVAEKEVAPLLPLRDAINRGEASFLKAIADAKLVLALDALVYFAHWITPERLPKRFDTHFYMAAAPAGQHALCDGGEAVEACWITPEHAMAAQAERRRRVMFPTRMNLELVGRARSVGEALEAAHERRIVTVTPRLEREAEGDFLSIPDEAGYGASRVRFDPARD